MVASGGLSYFQDHKTVERFCMKSNKWKFLPDMSKRRISHASVVLNNSFLYLIDLLELEVLNLECPTSWISLQVPNFGNYQV